MSRSPVGGPAPRYDQGELLALRQMGPRTFAEACAVRDAFAHFATAMLAATDERDAEQLREELRHWSYWVPFCVQLLKAEAGRLLRGNSSPIVPEPPTDGRASSEGGQR